MKLKTLKLATLVLGLALTTAAHARTHVEHVDTISTTHSYADSSENGGFSLGMSSYNGIPSTVLSGGSPSLAMLIRMGKGHHLQLNLSFASTSPTFVFMGGALYKYFLLEHNGYGFHIGGGGLFGTNGAFAMTAGGVAGFHFPFPGTNNQIAFHFDAGPVVNITGGSASFSMIPLSNLLGLSVFYTF